MIPYAEVIAGFSGFKGRLLLMAGIVVILGMGWTGGREIQRSGKVFGGPSATSVAANWTEGASGVKNSAMNLVDGWGKAAIPVGVSFMVAMLAASILRVAFKTGIALLVISGLAIWFLEHEGYVQVWHRYYETVRHSGTWLSMRADVVGQFLMAHLPSASAAFVGFGFGLKR
ncbi:MAG: hypothetical protein KDN18_04825 [Verrucomicrobiae bacterium]|nr:hypothetical protein [Verrucomicrobiae bacterium]